MTSRRTFLKQLSAATGAVVLMPAVSRCVTAQQVPEANALATPPLTRPEGWDPIAYNRERGNAGAIPDSYLGSINGPDGETAHLGKHLPYVPSLEAMTLPAGFLALMWGDPGKGYVQHPNAEPNESNQYLGHWYNWIRVRKATDDEAEEAESTYVSWPETGPDSSGAYAVYGGGEIRDANGVNTVYLAALPADVAPGDVVRIHAHCLTHGEYVDFMTL